MKNNRLWSGFALLYTYRRKYDLFVRFFVNDIIACLPKYQWLNREECGQIHLAINHRKTESANRVRIELLVGSVNIL